MKIAGYAGICSHCFEPVREGEEYRFPGSKVTFHARCVEQNPSSYYIRRECQRAGQALVESQSATGMEVS